MIGKLRLPFPLLSDARGDLARLYGLWNEEEGVAIPAIVIVDGSGKIVYLYAGSDFADRPPDEEILGALDDLESGASGYVGEEVAVWLDGAGAEDSVRPDRRPMSLDDLVPYYRGAYFTTLALKNRFGKWGSSGKDAFEQADRYHEMVRHYLEAIQETRRMSG